MKKLLLLAAAFVSVALVSCGESAMSPKAFNDKAISLFSAANTALGEFDAKITEGVKSNDLPSIATAADAAEAKVNDLLEQMKAIHAPEAAAAYKEAVVKSLEGVKSLIETGRKYSALGEGYSRSDFNALEKEYNAKRTQLSNDLQGVARAQSEFVQAVGSL